MPVTFEAQFLHGEPRMVDHTPGADVAAGKVVVTADTPRVAHLDIPNGVLGALAAEGGVYRMQGDGVIAADKKVYWDDTAKRITLTVGSNKVFGVTVTACSGANAYCQTRHDPGA